jgi:uncharacterized protein involved in outer membrane biogenesis
MYDTQSTERPQQRAVAALMPFFLDGAGHNVAAARLAIIELLDDYQPATPQEIQLAAQIVALTWAAITCLRSGVAATNLSMQEVLNLQNSAIALERSSEKTAKTLAARQQQRAIDPRAMTAENIDWDEGMFQLVINQALDKMNDARVKLAISAPTLLPAIDPKFAFLAAEKMAQSVMARRTGTESTAADQNSDREY